jgi:hypothetical protein
MPPVEHFVKFSAGGIRACAESESVGSDRMRRREVLA